jgi:hypothetical protein
MTTARVLIELPPGARVTEFERDLARLAAKYGTNLERSSDPRMPPHYAMRQRYVSNQSQPLPAA